LHPISAVIITFNEEENIGRCIQSLQPVADEIIVLDSYSTDKTVEIARELGAIVYQEKFRGYIGQKNAAIRLASNDYILSLDADEALDPKLASAILETKQSFFARAYSMNRCTCYCGHFIRHGLWYPDRKLRLFDRRIAHWSGINPHDKILVEDNTKVVHLPGDILHYSFNTPEDLSWQNNRLSSIAAASYYAKGIRSNWYKMIIRPTWAFLNGYILRLGFLNGWDGFTIAVQTAHQVFMKYVKLYRLQKLKREKRVTKILVPEREKKSASGGEI
jgi:glycosyltransferase involved in cell wall biosynthesis